MNNSPLIQEHAHWFRAGTWGMTDYDWYGGHTDLDDWWVEVWSNYVTEYGVDGYRLDTAIYRPDLWKRIRQNAAAALQGGTSRIRQSMLDRRRAIGAGRPCHSPRVTYSPASLIDSFR
jgi:uncharacterized lipoprotein YddW (UPF0748 family)